MGGRRLSFFSPLFCHPPYTAAVHSRGIIPHPPTPRQSDLNGGSCELNHISERDGETCKLLRIGRAIGTVYSALTAWFCFKWAPKASMCDSGFKWIAPRRYISITYEMSLLQVNFGNHFLLSSSAHVPVCVCVRVQMWVSGKLQGLCEGVGGWVGLG